ncbi:MAG: Fic family protein [Candidatus Acidiferrales bacterium]
MPANCPEWTKPETDEQLVFVVRGLSEFHLFIEKRSTTYILRHGDLRTWHEKIFKEVVPLSYYAGNYRCNDQRQPCLGQNVGVGSSPGAPYPEVPRLMREYSDYMRSVTVDTDRFFHQTAAPAQRPQAVVQLAAAFMGKLLKIHPFINGNGRISRCVANYFLHRYGYPFLFSPPLPRPSGDYSTASAACMIGNFVPMYRYLLQVLACKTI